MKKTETEKKSGRRPARRTLEREIEAYFAGISRTRTLQESVPTGETDARGKPVCELRDVINDLGQPIRVTEFMQPPGIGELCLYLGMTREEWAACCDSERCPELARVTAQAMDRIRTYLDRELLVREGKDVRGVIFDLENNYGCEEKHSVSGAGVNIIIEGDAAGCDE